MRSHNSANEEGGDVSEAAIGLAGTNAESSMGGGRKSMDNKESTAWAVVRWCCGFDANDDAIKRAPASAIGGLFASIDDDGTATMPFLLLLSGIADVITGCECGGREGDGVVGVAAAAAGGIINLCFNVGMKYALA